ncbi:hypothetical protein, partial [Streptodolium elevatio]
RPPAQPHPRRMTGESSRHTPTTEIIYGTTLREFLAAAEEVSAGYLHTQLMAALGLSRTGLRMSYEFWVSGEVAEGIEYTEVLRTDQAPSLMDD